MIISEWLDTTQRTFGGYSTTPRLDAEVLLCDALDQNKAWLIAHSDDEIKGTELETLGKQVARRLSGEPLAYIRGFAEFYGRRFAVNKHVLVPRPESETMIELLTQKVGDGRWEMGEISIVDVGTGSGALGITATLELQKLSPAPLTLNLILIDIDLKCLKVAQKNADTHGVNAKLLQGDLLEPYLSHLPSPNTQLLILANLPYVPDNYRINISAAHEPELALFGGEDGLDLYRKLFLQLSEHRTPNSEFLVLTESLPFQHGLLRDIAKENGFRRLEERDLIQSFSII